MVIVACRACSLFPTSLSVFALPMATVCASVLLEFDPQISVRALDPEPAIEMAHTAPYVHAFLPLCAQ